MWRTDLRNKRPQHLHISIGLIGLDRVKTDNDSIGEQLDTFISYIPGIFSVMVKGLEEKLS